MKKTAKSTAKSTKKQAKVKDMKIKKDVKGGRAPRLTDKYGNSGTGLIVR